MFDRDFAIALFLQWKAGDPLALLAARDYMEEHEVEWLCMFTTITTDFKKLYEPGPNPQHFRIHGMPRAEFQGLTTRDMLMKFYPPELRADCYRVGEGKWHSCGMHVTAGEDSVVSGYCFGPYDPPLPKPQDGWYDDDAA